MAKLAGQSAGKDAVKNGHKESIRRWAFERMDRLRISFPRLGADAFLVSHLPNIQYLCGFTGSSALLLVEVSSSTLFTDSRYTFQARQEVKGARVKIVKQGLLRAAAEGLRGRGKPRRVAYSAGNITVSQMAA